MIIQNDKQFHLFPSHVGLRNYILYYQIIFPSSDTFDARYTLMPNACGTLSLAFDGNTVHAELWGASMTPVLLGMEPNRHRVLLLIQLSPYGLFQITRQNQAQFADQRLSLTDIDRELCTWLHQALELSASIDELADTCETILFRRMEQHIVSNALLATAALISERHGQIQVQEAARQSGYSQRHLNRLFLTQIGMNMKNYARLIRFHYVLKHISASPRLFATLSQRAGYFDQAHFDKDFKAVSGVTPQTYLRTMSDFYYDGTEIYPIISSKEE